MQYVLTEEEYGMLKNLKIYMCKTTKDLKYIAKKQNVFAIDEFNKAIADEITICGKIAMKKLEDNLTELV
jgi:hypothetical protein